MENKSYQVDTILFNGKIFTAEPTRPYVEAVAIGRDRIVARPSSTPRCRGRRPGFGRPVCELPSLVNSWREQ